MTSNQQVTVELDEASGLAYIRFSDDTVVRTTALTDAINIDLDEYGVAVGIGVLDLETEMPFQRFITEFNVRTGPDASVTEPARVPTLC